MSALEFNRPRRRLIPGRGFFYVLLVVIIVAGGFYLIPRFEWHKPEIKITPEVDTIGLAPVEITVNDRGRGLKSFGVVLDSGGTSYPLAAEEYDQPVAEKKFTVLISSKLTGLKEGPAVLRVSARDRSLWNLFRGNETVVQKKVTIDITPPTLELIADDRYVNFGGVGMLVYKPSADTATTGVKIGQYFFPGYKGQIKEMPDYYIAYFAHPYNVGENERAALVATDKAGNAREMKLGARQGSPKDIFVKVNKELRKENEAKIKSITEKSTPSMLWKNAFTQLSNSKVEANFADARTYIYKDETIDNAYHLGYDLSVTKHYPAEAANSGVVAFTGDLGIYGNTVIIDHGLGLFTLYSHLSSIDVKVGNQIKQQQVIGKTGETGLAAGDHLHYGVYLHGVAILPVEWWDEKWIRDNVEPKLAGKSSEAVQEEKSPKSTRKVVRKRKR